MRARAHSSVQESLSSRDEAGVKVKQLHVAPAPLGECESVPSGEVVEEGAPLERLLVDRGSVPGVENCRKLIEIPTEKPCDAFWLVELCPETGLDLGHFLDPDHIGTTGAVEDVTTYVMVGRAAPRARGRSVSFCHNVDFF